VFGQYDIFTATSRSLPENWALHPGSGLAADITAVGSATINGQACRTVTFRLYGTTAAGVQSYVGFDVDGVLRALVGETWVSSVYLALVTGGTNLTNVTGVQLNMDYWTAANGYLSGGYNGASLTTTLTRFLNNSAVAPATTDYVKLSLQITTGGAVDFRFMVAAPQCEQASSPTTYVFTSSATGTWNTRTPWGPNVTTNSEQEYYPDTAKDGTRLSGGNNPFSISNSTLSITGAATPVSTTYTIFDTATADAAITLSTDKLTPTRNSGFGGQKVLGVNGKTSGKFYFEVKPLTTPSGNYTQYGIAVSTVDKDMLWLGNGIATFYPYGNSGSPSYLGNGGNTAISGLSGTSIIANDLVGIAVDLDNKTIWFRVNGGNWNGNATHNPATNTGGFSFSALSGTFHPIFGSEIIGHSATYNFGATAFGATAPSGFTGWAAASGTAYANSQPYTSGMLTTYNGFARLYGYYECRMKCPPGQGVWPSFWLLPNPISDQTNVAEIDVMEWPGTGVSTTTVYQTVHTGLIGADDPAQFYATMTANDMSDNYHLYGVDWRADRISYYVDRVFTGSLVTPSDCKTPMYMLLNLALGGTWPGAVVNTGQIPAVMQVDYVRVWDKLPF
jgi:hypothetical protein